MTDEERLAYALKGLSVLRHDVRNLMASVEIIADRMRKSEDERLAKAAPMLVDSMRRTVELGVAAGELASVQVGTPERVALVAAAARALDDSAQRDATAVDTAGLGDHAVRATPAHVDRMLGALIDNGLALADPGHVALHAEADGDAVVVTARCAGQVPDYAREKLFVPYGGAKRRGGTGLGLPIARIMAEAAGGTATLRETGEDGTVFALRLPKG